MGSNPGGRLVDATTCCGLTAAIDMETFVKLTANRETGPQALTVVPATVAAGATGITLTVTGTGFVAEDIIMVDGVDQSTGFSSATTLAAINVVASATPGHTHVVEVRSDAHVIKGTGSFRTT